MHTLAKTIPYWLRICQKLSINLAQTTRKYKGPYTALHVSDSHVIIPKDEFDCRKDKTIPIHTVRHYNLQNQLCKTGKRKSQKDDYANLMKTVS